MLAAASQTPPLLVSPVRNHAAPMRRAPARLSLLALSLSLHAALRLEAHANGWNMEFSYLAEIALE